MSSRVREKLSVAITESADISALRTLREAEQNRLSLAMASSPADAVVDSLRELHDALTTRVLHLAQQELARRGFDAPPVPYAYLLFGSGGRLEQTFASDQDSGIVFADASSEEQAAACRSYFPLLADTVVRLLIELGYPPCQGSVIASNPEWCLPVSKWENKIDGWFADPNWEHVRYLLILADARAVAGDGNLSGGLKNRFFTDVLQSPDIIRRMMENTLRHKVLLGVFGQLLRERYGENAGGVDIKYGAYIPMVNVIRLMAVQAGVRETSTLGRIAALRQAGSLTLREAEEARSAFLLLLRMRLLTAVSNETGEWTGTGKIAKEQLTKQMAAELKKTLKFGRKLQRRVEREMQDRFGGR